GRCPPSGPGVRHERLAPCRVHVRAGLAGHRPGLAGGGRCRPAGLGTAQCRTTRTAGGAVARALERLAGRSCAPARTCPPLARPAAGPARTRAPWRAPLRADESGTAPARARDLPPDPRHGSGTASPVHAALETDEPGRTRRVAACAPGTRSPLDPKP